MDILLQLLIIWFAVLLASFFAQKTKLTPALFCLFFGFLMVNLGILPQEANEFIKGISELGIILIMFALGFEESPQNFFKTLPKSWGIALFGALAPFSVAYLCAMTFWEDYKIALLVGLTMGATAVSLSMVSLKSENLHRTKAAMGIMASAVLDNIVSLILIALVIPIVTGQAELTLYGISIIILEVFAFFAVVSILGLWIFPKHELGDRFQWLAKLNFGGIRRLLTSQKGERATLVILLLALGASQLAYVFGLHPAIGAYLAGLILKDEYFLVADDPPGKHYEQTKRIIDDVAFSWIGPVFFVNLGTHIILAEGMTAAIIYKTMIFTMGLMVAQIVGASLAAHYTAKMNWHQSSLVGFGMLGRAELAFLLLNIGYIQYAIFSQEIFYTLMFTIFWLNLSVPITIKCWKRLFNHT